MTGKYWEHPCEGLYGNFPLQLVVSEVDRLQV